jgi:hypothetical protein
MEGIERGQGHRNNCSGVLSLPGRPAVNCTAAWWPINVLLAVVLTTTTDDRI